MREKTGDVVRTAFAVHTYNAVFARLVRHPRMIEPVDQMLGGPVYIHQFKINGKAAFDGDVWQWHQDYGTWAADDDMPEPRAMNLAVFLDEVNEFNGPLMFIPRSHRPGQARDAGHDAQHDQLSPVDHRPRDDRAPGPRGRDGGTQGETDRLDDHLPLRAWCTARRRTCRPGVGRSSTSASARVDNAIRRFKRPEWIAHRDFAPITTLPDDCLLRPYDVALPWKDGTPEAALR